MIHHPIVLYAPSIQELLATIESIRAWGAENIPMSFVFGLDFGNAPMAMGILLPTECKIDEQLLQEFFALLPRTEPTSAE